MNEITFEKTPTGTTTTAPNETSPTELGGAASFANAESIEILNLLGDAEGGSCCGGGCCSAE